MNWKLRCWIWCGSILVFERVEIFNMVDKNMVW